MAVGSPAKVKRKLSEEEIQSIRDSAEHYVGDIQSYLSK
jgi:carbonic anhydrase/acetyltransferase-like protein (isoleucine patch superfamily)